MTDQIELKEMNETENNAKAEDNAKVIGWDQADVLGSKYVKLETDEEKVLTIQNWKLIQRADKFDPDETEKVFFRADIIEEDGEAVEKLWESPSMRLRMKLRKILENRKPNKPLKISITRVGEKFQTQYIIKAIE